MVEAATETHRELLDRLDALHETHLQLLDAYTEARHGLHSSLAAGFLSLAQANFSSSNRARYGRDYYDQRMQALRVAQLADPAADGPDMFRIVESPARPHQPSQTGNDLPDARDAPTDDADAGADGSPREQQKPATTRDPLCWFGVLVPPPLRAAQAHFTSAITNQTAQVATLAARLREAEIGIRRARKKLAKLDKQGAKAVEAI